MLHFPELSLVKNYLLDLQQRICDFVAAEDGIATFIEDRWDHSNGGGGLTRVLVSDGAVEKAGVNFSHVYGQQLPPAATVKRPELAGAAFQALGVSVVIHPRNPYAPTSHMNVRFIVVEKEQQFALGWFGGGFDLTPYYGFIEDCVHWHMQAKAACDPFGADVYPKYKKWCDQYFFLKHRNEPRGIGGIFFDDLTVAPSSQWDFAQCFSFAKQVGNHYIKAYQPILARRKTYPFSEKERDFQRYRRGRYVEFNLLYDRGTLFGLQSGGRTESILMSLPPQVAWWYDWHPQSGTEEERLYKEFLIQKEWV